MGKCDWSLLLQRGLPGATHNDRLATLGGLGEGQSVAENGQGHLETCKKFSRFLRAELRWPRRRGREGFCRQSDRLNVCFMLWLEAA